MTKYQVTARQRPYIRGCWSFATVKRKRGAGLPDVSTGDFPELFEDRCIEDNYTDIVAIEPMGEDE